MIPFIVEVAEAGKHVDHCIKLVLKGDLPHIALNKFNEEPLFLGFLTGLFQIDGCEIKAHDAEAPLCKGQREASRSASQV